MLSITTPRSCCDCDGSLSTALTAVTTESASASVSTVMFVFTTTLPEVTDTSMRALGPSASVSRNDVLYDGTSNVATSPGSVAVKRTTLLYVAPGSAGGTGGGDRGGTKVTEEVRVVHTAPRDTRPETKAVVVAEGTVAHKAPRGTRPETKAMVVAEGTVAHTAPRGTRPETKAVVVAEGTVARTDPRGTRRSKGEGGGDGDPHRSSRQASSAAEGGGDGDPRQIFQAGVGRRRRRQRWWSFKLACFDRRFAGASVYDEQKRCQT